MVELTRRQAIEDVASDLFREHGYAGTSIRDIARAFNVARRIDSGICHVNGPTVHDEAQMPFGGVKESGYGSEGGSEAIEA